MKSLITKPTFQETHPHLAKEWHPTKNNPLSPTDVTYGMGKTVWWQCQHGHEWQATINQRSFKNSQCPCCSGHRLQIGINDLATTHPHLASQWHPTKNNGLTPQHVRKGSMKKVWWQCEKGHEWEASLLNRSNGNQCPYCVGQRILVGYNDLSTTHPQIANEWHPTKNNDLTPQHISRGSKERVWWQCEAGHEWEASAIQRTHRNNRCPQCHPKGVKKGINDLASQRPDLALQWHPTKNQGLLPTQVSRNTLKSVWWQCEKGHEWEAVILYRHRGSDCPQCKKQSTPNPQAKNL